MLASATPPTLAAWLITLGGIVLVDLALSGDNALIIGAAASRLPGRQRLIAIVWGGAGAIILRVALTAVAARLLLIPLLQTAGALIIMIITIRLLIHEQPEESRDGERARPGADRLGPAIVTILAADASMSLDNILAIGALSNGNIPLLIFGLLLSMVLLLTASAIVARLIERFSWLMDLTAFVLAYTAASLVLRDPVVSGRFSLTGARAFEVTFGLLLFTALIDIVFRRARARRQRIARASTAPVAAQREPVSHPLQDR